MNYKTITRAAFGIFCALMISLGFLAWADYIGGATPFAHVEHPIYHNLTATDTTMATTPRDTTPTVEEVFEMAIDTLKQYEGFRAWRYRDTDGAWTIGYGHHMIDNYWRWNDSITEYSADTLLRSDLRARIQKVTEIYGLSDYRAISVALFIYNCGAGNYSSSTLKTLVDEGKPIDQEIIKWCHYTSGGVTRASDSLLMRRQFELFIYNMEDKKG